MPEVFSATTAEHVVSVVDAVLALSKSDKDKVAEFLDIKPDRAESALMLAEKLQLVSSSAGHFQSSGALSRLISTSKIELKAAVLRVALEAYEPFITFRMRLEATGNTDVSSRQTISIHDIKCDKDDLKDTLLSLGTFSGSLQMREGGKYTISSEPLVAPLADLADGCDDLMKAEHRVRLFMSDDVFDYSPREDVVLCLTDSLARVGRGDWVGAVTTAANAIESFLSKLAADQGVNIKGAHGITAKVFRFRDQKQLPKKIVAIGEYLGNVRNAVNHGADPEIGLPWTIKGETATAYVASAMSFLDTIFSHYNGRVGQI